MHNQPDIEYMTEALNQARKAKEMGDLPFGTVIVCDGKIVGRGKCENGTIGDVTDHAEILALREACKTLGRNKLQDCTVYSTNEPCPMCASAIFQAKIPEVKMGLTRNDLSSFLRSREIDIHKLADDSGYEISISSGLLKDQIFEQFKDIIS